MQRQGRQRRGRHVYRTVRHGRIVDGADRDADAETGDSSGFFGENEAAGRYGRRKRSDTGKDRAGYGIRQRRATGADARAGKRDAGKHRRFCKGRKVRTLSYLSDILGICYFIWLVLIILAVILLIWLYHRKKRKEEQKSEKKEP